MFLYETWNIAYRRLIRKITNSGFIQQLRKQLRLFMFEQWFHMQTPIQFHTIRYQSGSFAEQLLRMFDRCA